MKRFFFALPFVIGAISASFVVFDLLHHRLPDAVFSPQPEHHFGTVRPQQLSWDFQILNGHSYDVDLVSVKTACGCTKAKLDASKLKPGRSATIHCTYDLRGRDGDFATEVVVFCRRTGDNGTATDSIPCAAYANVDPIVHVSPSRLVFPAGAACTKRIDIDFTGYSVDVKQVLSSQGAFKPELSSDKHHISVRFNPSLWQETSGSPSLLLETNCPYEERIKIPIVVDYGAGST